MKAIFSKKNAGFTLIETLIYLVLFGILMGGAIVAAYSPFESGSRNSAKIIIQQEGNFFLGKIGWALSGITAVNFPASGATGSKLLVTTVDPAIQSIDIEQSLGNMIMIRGTATQALNNSNIVVDHLLFEHGSTGGVEWITSSFTLSSNTSDGKPVSQDFKSTKYIRK